MPQSTFFEKGRTIAMAKKMTPTQDRILVRRLEEEEKTAGGIIIPDSAKEKPIRGEVVAIGPGAKDDKGTIIPMTLSIGQVVIFGKWSGTEIKHEGSDFIIMKESDVLAIVE